MKNSFGIVFWDWMHLMRAEHAFMTFFAVIIGEILVTAASLPPFFSAEWKALGFPVFAFFSALGPALVTAGAFILNDYQGFHSDHANKRYERPLVRGIIKRDDAFLASMLLYAVGIAVSWIVSFTAFLIVIAFSAVSIIYDPLLKKKPFLGNLFIASSMAIPFLYGNFAISQALDPQVAYLAMIAFMVGLGRELLITLRDVYGDKKVGATTLPMVIGSKNTVLLSAFFILSAVMLSLAPLLKGINYYYLFFIAIADAFFLFVIVSTLKDASLESLKRARNYSLAGLILGLFAFATLAFSSP